MTGQDIKKQIEENEKLIEEILCKENFVLNSQIVFLQNANSDLRKICPHEDDGDGFCAFCSIYIGDVKF